MDGIAQHAESGATRQREIRRDGADLEGRWRLRGGRSRLLGARQWRNTEDEEESDQR